MQIEMKFKGPVKECLGVSCGVGVDSTAMVVGFAQRGIVPDYFIFADTGGEKAETYEYIATLDAFIRKHFPGKHLIVTRRAPTKARNGRGTYATLEEQCLINETLPSLAFGGRKCSNKWKHEAMEKAEKAMPECQAVWKAGGKVTKAIGYDAGPVDCRRPHIAEDERYKYRYPLREWGWDRERCIEEIEKAGLPVPMKSACFFCPASKPDEIRQLPPDMLRRIIEMEANAELGEHGLRAVDGLWRRPTKGYRGATKRPGSMAEFICGEELLPEFQGQDLVRPWWLQEGPQKELPEATKPSQVVEFLRVRAAAA